MSNGNMYYNYVIDYVLINSSTIILHQHDHIHIIIKTDVWGK